MICVTPNNVMKEYVRVMNSVDIDDSVKLQIIKNCARHSTLNRIKFRKFKITAVKKNKTADKI